MRSCSVRRRSSKTHQTSREQRRAARARSRAMRPPCRRSRAAGDQRDDRRSGPASAVDLEDLRDALARRHAPAADRAAVVLDDVRAQQPLAPGVAAPGEHARAGRRRAPGTRRRRGRAARGRAAATSATTNGPTTMHQVDDDGGAASPEAGVAAVAADRSVRVQHALRSAVRRSAATPSASRCEQTAAGRRRCISHPIVPRLGAPAETSRVTLRNVESAARTTDALSRPRATRSPSAAGTRRRWRRSRRQRVSRG